MFETPDIQPFLDSLFPGAFAQLFSQAMDSLMMPIVVGLLVFVFILKFMAGPKRRRSRKRARWRRPASGRMPSRRISEKLPEQLSGKAYVTDGDGISVKGREIRLARIDAPEQGQMATAHSGKIIDQGRSAKNALYHKVGGREVRVVVRDQDQYGRLVGTVYLGERDICREMVRDGFAWAYMEYGGEVYKQDEEEARQNKRGIWAQKDAIPPSLVRKKGYRPRG